MKRRDFIKRAALASAAVPFSLNGIPMNLLKNMGLLQMLAASSNNDRVLVLIQMHGGNDGLNMVIPIDQYSLYYNLRPNLAIPQSGNRRFITLDSNLPSNRQVGLHPDMVGAKDMYDAGKMAVLQSVSYPNQNGSHFRSRDIWFMGGDYDDYLASGWMGRYLDYLYPNYPTGYPNSNMPDPLAIEIGNGVSLAFHRALGIPVGLSVDNPTAFYNLINSVGVQPPISFPDSHAGDEIEYIMQMEQQANVYASRLKNVYDAGSNSSVVYPSTYPFIAPPGSLHNPLSPQFRIISRLLSGGCMTKIFLCRIGGFDTHANQVLNNDTSMGSHAALLYHISAAVKSFYDDLNALGLGGRVLTLTFSEFGRRPASNASYGTDHGNAAPILAFADCLNPGVYGNNPDLANLQYGNIPMGIDYRQVFTTAVKDWFGASDDAIQHVMFDQYVDNRIDFVNCKIGVEHEIYQDRYRLGVFPNPAREQTTVTYYIRERGHLHMRIFDMEGRVVREIRNEMTEQGEYQLSQVLTGLSAGTYHVSMEINRQHLTEKLVILP